jgi:hypothetical protein
MPSPPAQPRWALVSQLLSAAALIALLAISVGAPLIAWRSLPRKPEPPQSISSDLLVMNWPVIQRPEARPAGSVRLSEDAAVIGVSVDGRSRAYVVEAFGPTARHVVNDQLGRVPVTVTYCSRSDCAQVFTDPREAGPLAVSVGGFDRRSGTGALLLRVGSTLYRQDTRAPLTADAPPFPHAVADFVWTTWQQWRTAHPDTDVYLGPPTDGSQEAGG